MSFPPIYVINLPRDVERRAAISTRLDLMALQYRIVDAVDGKSLAPEAYDQRLRRRYFGRALTPGEIGCLLSHRQVCALMLAERCPEAIVLEDDAVLSPDFVDVIKALQHCAHQWDLVRFVGSPKIHARGFRRVRPLCGSYWLIRLPTTPGGSHAYLLNRKAAAVLESQLGQSFLPMDILQGWSWRTGLDTLAVYPTLAAQDAESGTTIGEERFSKAVALNGWERWLFPVNRFLYKTLDGWGKKRVWFGTWYRDRVIRRETARDLLP